MPILQFSMIHPTSLSLIFSQPKYPGNSSPSECPTSASFLLPATPKEQAAFLLGYNGCTQRLQSWLPCSFNQTHSLAWMLRLSVNCKLQFPCFTIQSILNCRGTDC